MSSNASQTVDTMVDSLLSPSACVDSVSLSFPPMFSPGNLANSIDSSCRSTFNADTFKGLLQELEEERRISRTAVERVVNISSSAAAGLAATLAFLNQKKMSHDDSIHSDIILLQKSLYDSMQDCEMELCLWRQREALSLKNDMFIAKPDVVDASTMTSHVDAAVVLDPINRSYSSRLIFIFIFSILFVLSFSFLVLVADVCSRSESSNAQCSIFSQANLLFDKFFISRLLYPSVSHENGVALHEIPSADDSSLSAHSSTTSLPTNTQINSESSFENPPLIESVKYEETDFIPSTSSEFYFDMYSIIIIMIILVSLFMLLRDGSHVDSKPSSYTTSLFASYDRGLGASSPSRVVPPTPIKFPLIPEPSSERLRTSRHRASID